MNFPEHKCGLYLTHNAYRDYHLSIEEAVAQFDSDYRRNSWLPGEREKALATGDIWELQWSPNTPVGFQLRLAASLEAVLRG